MVWVKRSLLILYITTTFLQAHPFTKIVQSPSQNTIADVNIPLTLTASKSFAKAHHLNFTVTEEKASQSGSACAHSPACILVLPFILVDMMTQENPYYMKVTMSEKDKPLFIGAYDLQSEKLIWGSIRQKDLLMTYDLLYLPQLQKKYLKNRSARVFDQELLKQYQKRYKQLNSPQKKEALIMEYFRLTHKLQPLMKEVFESPAYDDTLKAELVLHLCRKYKESQDRALYFNVLKQNTSLQVDKALFTCIKELHSVGEIQTSTVRHQVERLCKTDVEDYEEHFETLSTLFQLLNGENLSAPEHRSQGFFDDDAIAKQSWAAQAIRNAHCVDDSWRLLTNSMLAQPVETQKLFTLSKRSKNVERLLTYNLIQDQTSYKTFMFKLLNESDQDPISLLDLLYKRNIPYYSDKEIATLLQLYYSDNYPYKESLTSVEDLDYRKRAYILAILSHTEGVQKKPHIETLKKRAMRTPSDYLPFYFLGDKSYLDQVLKGLRHFEIQSRYNYTMSPHPVDVSIGQSLLRDPAEPSLILYTLYLYGFSDDERKKMHQSVVKKQVSKTDKALEYLDQKSSQYLDKWRE